MDAEDGCSVWLVLETEPNSLCYDTVLALNVISQNRKSAVKHVSSNVTSERDEGLVCSIAEWEGEIEAIDTCLDNVSPWVDYPGYITGYPGNMGTGRHDSDKMELVGLGGYISGLCTND